MKSQIQENTENNQLSNKNLIGEKIRDKMKP